MTKLENGITLTCDCYDKIMKIVKTKPEKGIHHNWMSLPIFDCAFMIDLVKNWSEKQLIDMQEGFGNTNYGDITVYQQLVIAGLEYYKPKEMMEILNIRMEHEKH